MAKRPEAVIVRTLLEWFEELADLADDEKEVPLLISQEHSAVTEEICCKIREMAQYRRK